MALIDRPDAWMAVIALSRPEPGPLTLTSTSLTPNFVAAAAAVSAARWAAKGVLLRLPLKPTVPLEAQQRASPLGSVIVTVVLLNVALICTTARLTLRRAFRFLALATGPLLPGCYRNRVSGVNEARSPILVARGGRDKPRSVPLGHPDE